MRPRADVSGKSQRSRLRQWTTRVIGGAGVFAGLFVLMAGQVSAVGSTISISVYSNPDKTVNPEGQALTYSAATGNAIATFTDSDSGCPSTCQAATDYTAAILGWGDGGSASSGTVVAPTAGSSTYTVTASHLYPDEKNNPTATPPTCPNIPCGYTVRVSITDIDGQSMIDTNAAGGGIAVNDQPFLVNPGSLFFNPSPGIPFTGTIGTFQDGNGNATSTDQGGTVPEYAVTIDWGDGTGPDNTTGGTTIGACNPGNPGLGVGQGCQVSVTSTGAGHTYLAAGTYNVAVIVGDGNDPRAVQFVTVANVRETTTCGANGTPLSPSAQSPIWLTACSQQQYQFKGSDGTTWQPMDGAGKLSVAFTPYQASMAVITANTDLWTANAGFNQDIGLAVNGDVYTGVQAWKESGGVSGTFSPNAAFVQAAIQVKANTAYTATLVWKASHADAGSIYAGAGPIGGKFSPTRMSIQVVPNSLGQSFTSSAVGQMHLANSDGVTWTDMNLANLSQAFTPPAGNWLAFISGNADLWTSTAGKNQDIGINLNGGTFTNQVVAWKESGGASTFNPNAAFVQAAVPVVGGTLYTAKLQWKANSAGNGTIYAAAGSAGNYSPSSLTVVLVPTPGGSAVASSTRQYSNNTGTTWVPMDITSGTPLTLTLSPSSDSSYRISASSDLWTMTGGFNQDFGILISGGVYATGQLVAWKESGGSHTFAPNAAFVTTDVTLTGGTSYTVIIVWRASHSGTSTIMAGAGHSPTFSPTSLTALQLS